MMAGLLDGLKSSHRIRRLKMTNKDMPDTFPQVFCDDCGELRHLNEQVKHLESHIDSLTQKHEAVLNDIASGVRCHHGKLDSEMCSQCMEDSEVDAEDYFYLHEAEIVDLNAKHKEELKAQRYSVISECLNLINDKFTYDRVFELLNAGDV